MDPVEELAYECKIDRICELFEQIALEAVVVALEKIVQRNESIEMDKRQKLQNEDYQF